MTAAKPRNTAARVPGAPDDTDNGAAGANADDTTQAGVAAGAGDTALPTTQPASAQRVARLPGQAPSVAAQLGTADSATTNLPLAQEVNAKSIRGPVLTKQGWVVPDESGKAPAQR